MAARARFGDDFPLPRTAAVLEEGIERGHHIGSQIYVSRRAERVAEGAIGESRPGVAMATDTLVLWLSMGKPLTAVLIARLVDAGKLDIHAPVAEVIPEFAQAGKEQVTVAHLLTHSGGFRNVGSNWTSEPWDAILRRIGGAALEEEWIVGETAGYHTSSSWFVLAEVARRVLGHDDPGVMYRREILEPLGMGDSWIGMPRHRWIDYGTRVGFMYDTHRREGPEAELRPLGFANSEAGSVLCRPGGNARGPMRELGRLYEQLLVDRGDIDVAQSRVTSGATPHFLSTDTASLFTSCRLCEVYDKTFGTKLDWGYGFIVNAPGRRFPYNYGPHASATAFGHSGNQSTCAFADPEHGLVVAWATNGMPGELPHQRRQTAVNKAVYEDLSLA